MYQALYRKYRPKTLDDVWGQDVVVKIIKNSILNNCINHAYLFSGPRGTGKTSVAKILSYMVNCENLDGYNPCGVCVNCTQINNDIIEIDAASNNGVDEIREIREKVNLVPTNGKYKIYIIDEVHMLTTGAFNALLKTLEEPPAHIIFILATTDPHKIPETILSRCQRLDFKKISDSSIVNRLKQISDIEGILVEEQALIDVAKLSDGGMRDSIGMLDSAYAYCGDKITSKDIYELNGIITDEEIIDLILNLEKKNLNFILEQLDKYNECGKNFVKLSEKIVNIMRKILFYKEANMYFKSKETNIEIYKNISSEISIKNILKYIYILNEALIQMKFSNNPKLILEVSLINMVNSSNPAETNSINLSESAIDKQLEESKISKKIVETKKIETNKAKKSNLDLNKIKTIRIENTLSRFDKKKLKIIKDKLKIEEYITDSTFNKEASILLDGKLKAASDEYLIFVYEKEKESLIFNNNITNIEEFIKNVLNEKFKVISTNEEEWEKIKNDFNNKNKKYEYQEESSFLKKQSNEFSNYEDIIEYN